MTDVEIRRKILELIYERFKEHPYYIVTPEEFEKALNIGLKTLNYNIIYLEEKGYVELQKPLEGNIFVGARITSKGVDLIEDEYQFNIVFPDGLTETSTQLAIFKEFDGLISRLESLNDTEIDKNLKDIIIEEIKEVQKELKKIEPSYLKIKNLLTKIKENNSDIGDKVMVIIKNPIVTKILMASAKKEINDM